MPVGRAYFVQFSNRDASRMTIDMIFNKKFRIRFNFYIKNQLVFKGNYGVQQNISWKVRFTPIIFCLKNIARMNSFKIICWTVRENLSRNFSFKAIVLSQNRFHQTLSKKLHPVFKMFWSFWKVWSEIKLRKENNCNSQMSLSVRSSGFFQAKLH